jgi:3-oxoacyl-[acyl-carrier-protein] synthase-1
MPEDVLVLGMGMMTAVGLSPAETLASVRAGTARFVTSDFRDHLFEPMTVAEVPPDALPPLVDTLAREPLPAREARMLRLATTPLQQAATSAAHAPPRLPLYLALPETETRIPLDKQQFLNRLAAQTPAIDLPKSLAEFSGRAGSLAAIGSAARAIADGQVPFALAGGVDSFLDPFLLATLDMESRLKSASHLDGFIPGEGAAFLLLAARSAAEGIRARPLAKLSPVAQAMEPGHLYSKEPYRGEGLSQALAQLFVAAPPPSPIAAVYSGMNGESHWGKEWSIAFLRNRKFITPAARLHHPADCYGDIGAAAGPLLVAQAAHGISSGYRPDPALIICSNDHAPRSALQVLRA